jgi:hypothetical protein
VALPFHFFLAISLPVHFRHDNNIIGERTSLPFELSLRTCIRSLDDWPALSAWYQPLR